MGGLLQDIRYAVRILFGNPVFTVVSVSALALGIGANTAIFSVVNGVLLKPLPLQQPERIVRLMRSWGTELGDSVSIPKFTLWSERSQVFDYVAAYDFAGPGLNLGGGDLPEQIRGIHVTWEFFPLFGAVPAAGRMITAEEDLPGGPRVVVLSHGLWKRRYGGDPGVVGKAMVLDGEAFTVVGVLSEGFRSYPPADVWVPLQADRHSNNHGHYLSVAARLKPGVTIESAQARLKIVGEEFRREHPKWMGERESVAVVPFQEAEVGNIRIALLVLSGAVGFVLLIACGNVANLLLARAAGRSKEIALRAALGAGRGRIIRQLLTESLLLALLGGLAGLLLGSYGLRILLALAPGNLPRADELLAAPLSAAADGRVLGFTLLISLLTGILFGLFPALQISKTDLNDTLKEGHPGLRAGRHSYARGFLIVSETALALVLLTGASLFIRTFYSLRAVDPGFDTRNLLTFQTSLGGGSYDSTTKVETFVRQALQRMLSLPAVEAATMSINIPLQGGPDLPVLIEGRALPEGGSYHGDIQWRNIAPEYFAALKVPLLRGRTFDERDSSSSSPVVIINSAMARAYWSNEDPIGHRITIGGDLGPEFKDEPREIIGVVGDVKERGLQMPAPAVLYIPYGQVPDGMTRLANKIIPMSWIVRTASNPRGLAEPIRKEILGLDRNLAVAKVRTMEEILSEVTAGQNFNMILLSIFAGMALLLAAIGIYGVMSYSVRQRTREIGIRIALGAGNEDLIRLVVGQALVLASAGVVLGLAASYGLARVITTLLFGVKATDPLSFFGVAGLLFGVALLASYIPARRAARVDPIAALRCE